MVAPPPLSFRCKTRLASGPEQARERQIGQPEAGVSAELLCHLHSVSSLQHYFVCFKAFAS